MISEEMQAHRNDCDRGRSYYVELFARCSTLMQAIVALPKPVIAAIEGVATAAGCQLVAACDLAIAGEKARFGLSGVNFGLFCSTPLVAVGRDISRKRAMEMAMTGQALQRRGRRALRPRQPRGSRGPRARGSAGAGQGHRPAVAHDAGDRQARLLRPDRAPLDEAYAVASLAMIDNLAEPDSVEGMGAFIEKRRPNWGAGEPGASDGLKRRGA